MTKKNIFLLSSLLALPCQVIAQNEPLSAQKAIYVEFGGQGIIQTINFDTRFSKNAIGGMGGRIGFGSLAFIGISGYTIPVGINYLKPLKKEGNYMEFGGGITYSGISAFGFNVGVPVTTLDWGYRYQPVDGGANFRAVVTPIIVAKTVLPYVGLSLGYTFGKSRRIVPKAKNTPPVYKKPPEVVVVKKPEEQWSKMADSTYRLENVYFDQGESKLLPESYNELDKLASLLRNNTKMTIRVEGHTERLGDEALNVVLSENRAQSVRNYLIDKGISGKKISYKGYGSSRPVTSDNSVEARRQNRRVTFVILTQ